MVHGTEYARERVEYQTFLLGGTHSVRMLDAGHRNFPPFPLPVISMKTSMKTGTRSLDRTDVRGVISHPSGQVGRRDGAARAIQRALIY